jgi:hypothetical protein
LGNKAEEKRVSLVSDTYIHYRNHWQDVRDESEKSHRYFLGDQWDNNDKDDLDKAGMPYLTKNIVLPIVNKFTGIERSNRTDLIVEPAENGMEEIADGFTRLNYYFSKKDRLTFKMSDLFLLGIIGNMGSYVRPYFTTESDPLGQIKFKIIPGLNVMIDPGGRDYSLANDHKKLIYTTWWTKEDAIGFFPDKKEEIQRSLQGYQPGLWGILTRKTGERTDFRDDKQDQMEGRYRVVEMWSLDRIWETQYFNPENMQKYIIRDPEEIKKLRFLFPDLISRRVKDSKLSVDVTIADSILLRTGLSSLQNGTYPFIPFYPYYLDGDMMGVLKNLIGYQDEHNKQSSAILHILNTMANSGWVAKKGSTNADILEEEGSSTGFILWYTGEKPEKITPNQIPSGHAYMDEQSKRGIYETSGLGENMLGRSETQRETGELFKNRVQEGYSMVQGVFDNFKMTKEMLGDYLIWLYQNVLPEEKIAQILEREAMPDSNAIDRMVAREIATNKKHGNYNVVSENIAHAASAKEREDRIMFQLAKVVPPELVDWPTLMETAGTPRAKQMANYAREKMKQLQGGGAPGNEVGPEAYNLINQAQE